MNRKGYHAGWDACLYVDWDSTLFPVPRSQIPGPRRTQARGTMNQGRSSTDMKREIADVIQTEGALLCPTALPRRGSKMGIPGGCSGPLASARLGPGKKQRRK